MFNVNELRSLLEAHGGIEERFLEPLTRYGALLLEANRQFNLTGAKNMAELAPHILDSLTLRANIQRSYVDIGSGGGLPAIPLAIVTGVPVTMVETTLKKAKFLESMLAEFGLVGEVVAQRAEVAAHDPRLRERFHSGTARAVSSAPTVAELLLSFIEIGGKAFLQRGKLEERERNALADAAPMLGAQVERIEPMEGDKYVIVVEKREPTHQKYPRRIGVPEKKPLCY